MKLSRRALNRATLARQLLLHRHTMPAKDAIGHLVGMQAQAPNPPYVGLWSRLDGFTQDDLARLVHARDVVRIALMRSTIHLVTAEDCLTLRPLLQAVYERGFMSNWGKNLPGMDYPILATAGRKLVDDAPLTFAELGARLAEQWPDRDPASMA